MEIMIDVARQWVSRLEVEQSCRSTADVILAESMSMQRFFSLGVQELMEIITGSDSPPRRLTTSQRIRRLEDERRLPEEAIKKVENTIRKGLWGKHLDNVRRHRVDRSTIYESLLAFTKPLERIG